MKRYALFFNQSAFGADGGPSFRVTDVSRVRRFTDWQGGTERAVLKRCSVGSSSNKSNSSSTLDFGAGSPDIAEESVPRSGSGRE